MLRALLESARGCWGEQGAEVQGAPEAPPKALSSTPAVPDGAGDSELSGSWVPAMVPVWKGLGARLWFQVPQSGAGSVPECVQWSGHGRSASHGLLAAALGDSLGRARSQAPLAGSPAPLNTHLSAPSLCFPGEEAEQLSWNVRQELNPGLGRSCQMIPSLASGSHPWPPRDHQAALGALFCPGFVPVLAMCSHHRGPA